MADERDLRRKDGWAVGQVTDLCSRCGFDIPGEADACPTCGPDVEPARAALQVSGVALPTRSVHRVPHLAPRRERAARRARPTGAARSAFGYASLFAVIALVGAMSGWAAGLPHFVLAVPTRTVDWFDDVTRIAIWGAVLVGAMGFVAVALAGVRRVTARSRRRDTTG